MEEERKDEIFQTPPQFESNLRRGGRSSGIKRISVILVSIVVVGLLIFGATRFFAGSGSESSEPEITPTPTIEEFPTDVPPTPDEDASPTPNKETSPTPKAVNSIDKASGLDRSKLSIHILNGSGVTGAAQKASDFLEGLGYNVIQIGNAQSDNYEKTVIQIRSAKDDYLSLLKKDLSANYSVGSTSADLVTSERADTIVIIGKQ